MIINILSPIIKIIFLLYLILYFGLFYGIILYCLLFKIYILLIQKIFNCEFIKGSDLLFLYEYDKRPNVIIANIITENKITFEQLKNLIRNEGILKFKKLRQKVFMFLNEYYWCESDINECLQNIQLITRKFVGKKDIIEFNESLFPIHLNRSKPLWEIYFIENYSSESETKSESEFEEGNICNKSLIVFKYHHSLGDGIALVNLFSSLSSDFNLDNYSQLKSVSTLKLFLLYILSPYYMIKAQPKTDQNLKNLPNPFSNYNVKPSGESKLSITKEFSFTKLRNVYKKYPNTTFNDLSWTLIVRSLLKWANRKEEEEKDEEEDEISMKFKSICGVMGVSARKNLNPYDMDNQSGGQLVSYKYEENFEKSLEQIRTNITPLKKKNMMISASLILEFLGSYLLFDYLIKKIGEDAFKNVSFIFTNVQGPMKKVHLKTANNVEISDISTFVPHGNLVFSIIAFTYNDNVKFSLQCDKKGLPLDEIKEYLEKEIDEILSKYS